MQYWYSNRYGDWKRRLCRKCNKNFYYPWIGGKSFKVASIANRAFAGTKVQKVIISSNVETIGANACRGCKKLSVVTIQSAKLKSIGRDTFRGISRIAKIKVPSKCLSAYRKLLKKGGQGKKVKIKS